MNNPYQTFGAFSWNELMTDNLKESKEFYAEVFDWDFVDMPMPEGTYSVIEVKGEKVGGMMEFPKETPPGMPPHWGPYVTVNSVEESIQKVLTLGGEVMVEPRDIPDVGRFAVIKDRRGAPITIIAYLPSVE